MGNEGSRMHGQEQRASKLPKLPQSVSILRDIQVNDVTTSSGRPLFEVNASPEALDRMRKRGVPMEERISSYQDSREGLPYNRSALQEIGTHFQDFLDNLAWINESYFGGDVPNLVTVHDISRMSEIASAIPSFVINRGRKPFLRHGNLPDSLGDMHKIGAGVRMAADGMKSRFEKLDIPAETPITPDRFYEFADRTGLLISTTSKQVCAAPPKVMLQAFDALFYREGANPKNASAGKMLDDFSAISEFSRYYTHSILRLDMFQTKLTSIHNIYDALNGMPLPRTHWETFISLLLMYKETEVEFIEQMNSLQVDMNRVLGRQYKDIRPVTQGEISQIVGLDAYKVGIEIGIPKEVVTAIRRDKL